MNEVQQIALSMNYNEDGVIVYAKQNRIALDMEDLDLLYRQISTLRARLGRSQKNKMRPLDQFLTKR